MQLRNCIRIRQLRRANCHRPTSARAG
jgi:hypothetical protein